MKKLTLLILFITAGGFAQDTSVFFNAADAFFKTYIQNGKVKYAEIKQNPKALEDLLQQAKQINVPVSNAREFQAFWINAYNLGVINGIVKNYPVESPLDIDGFFDRARHSMGLRSVTLDAIEHELLFGNFPDEARLHFALVCAAKGCPPLIAEAYTPEKLEQQLERQTRLALNDPQFVRLQNNKVLFSEILKWNLDHFTRRGSLIDYVNRYRNEPIPAGFEVGFYDYNWELNEL